MEKRKEIYERDQWICQYCGDRVTPENATLDHFVPQCKSGTNKKENLRTACLLCNSVKSGKSYEEAAVYLLKSIQTRRGRDAQKDS
ncbi:MAG: HNH endonuclease [Nitrospiraceae bacterium]|nr:HNH endonuclease [Nitrospiraceae bacterium]